MANPTEEDLRAALATVVEITSALADSQLSPDTRAVTLRNIIASAITAEREKAAKFCDALCDKASINETEFDSIGEPCLEPNVKYWEGQRVAAEELASVIRAGDKEVE